MAALAKRRYTLEEYLELEKHAEERYAYCGGEVVAMSGASCGTIALCAISYGPSMPDSKANPVQCSLCICASKSPKPCPTAMRISWACAASRLLRTCKAWRCSSIH